MADKKTKEEKESAGEDRQKSKPKNIPVQKAVPKMEPGMKHFVRIINTDLDGRKHIIVGLTKIKGIGYTLSSAICTKAKIEKTKKTGFINEEEVKRLEDVIRNPLKYDIPVWMLNRRKDYETGENKHLFTTDLDFTRSNDIRRLQKVKSYKGLRHAWGLPVRGQKTKSNFRRNKGNALGVTKKKVAV